VLAEPDRVHGQQAQLQAGLPNGSSYSPFVGLQVLILNFASRGQTLIPGVSCPPGVNFVPWG
jgi:hypothetical protein